MLSLALSRNATKPKIRAHAFLYDDTKVYEPVAVLRWGQGAQAPKFLDTVVLLLVELIGSIVISLKFRLAVVASQMIRGQAPQIFFS